MTLSSGENVQSENEIMSTQCSSSSFYAICTIRFQFVSGHWESDSKSASRSNRFFFEKVHESHYGIYQKWESS